MLPLPWVIVLFTTIPVQNGMKASGEWVANVIGYF
jgi:hypothetical protein